MRAFRERFVLPVESDLGAPASAAFVGRVASAVAAGLERSVGPVHWREGDTTGVDWTAEGFVDGALVVVCLRPSSREVSVLVDPQMGPPSTDSTTRGTWLLLGALAFGVMVGALKSSWGWGLVSSVSLLGASVGVDVVRQQRRLERVAAAFDATAWRRRFEDAIAAALSVDRG